LVLLGSYDNASNKYSDNYYLAEIIQSLSNTNTSGINDSEKMQKQIKRYLNFEKLMPSYHNTIASACLRALCNLSLRRRVPVDIKLYEEYTLYEHYEEVRQAAYDSLVQLLPFYHPTIISALYKDPNPKLKYNIFLTMTKIHLKNKLIQQAQSATAGPHLGVGSLKSPAHMEISNGSDGPHPNYKPIDYSVPTAEHSQLVEYLWDLLNNGTRFDARLRGAVINLYKALYGLETPKCLTTISQHKPPKEVTVNGVVVKKESNYRPPRPDQEVKKAKKRKKTANANFGCATKSRTSCIHYSNRK